MARVKIINNTKGYNMLKSTIAKLTAIFAIVALMVPGLALANGGQGKVGADISSGNMKASASSETKVHALETEDEDDDADVDEDNDSDEDINEDTDDDNDSDSSHLHGREQAASRHTMEGRHDNGKHLGWFKDTFMGGDKDDQDDEDNDQDEDVFSGKVTAVSDSGFTFTTKNGSTYTVETEDATIVSYPNSTLNSEIEVGDRVHVVGTETDDNIVAVNVYDFADNLKSGVAEGTVIAVADDSITVQKEDGTEITVNINGDTTVVNSEGDDSALDEVDDGDEVKVSGFWDSILDVFHAIKISLQ
jgi:hypothetical protein